MTVEDIAEAHVLGGQFVSPYSGPLVNALLWELRLLASLFNAQASLQVC